MKEHRRIYNGLEKRRNIFTYLLLLLAAIGILIIVGLSLFTSTKDETVPVPVITDQKEQDSEPDETEKDTDEKTSVMPEENLFNSDIKPIGDDPKIYTCGGTCNDNDSHSYQINCSSSDSNSREFKYNISSEDSYQELTGNFGFDADYHPDTGSVSITISDENGVLTDKDSGNPLSFTIKPDSQDINFKADISDSDYIIVKMYCDTDSGVNSPYFAILSDGLILWR